MTYFFNWITVTFSVTKLFIIKLYPSLHQYTFPTTNCSPIFLPPLTLPLFGSILLLFSFFLLGTMVCNTVTESLSCLSLLLFLFQNDYIYVIFIVVLSFLTRLATTSPPTLWQASYYGPVLLVFVSIVFEYYVHFMIFIYHKWM